MSPHAVVFLYASCCVLASLVKHTTQCLPEATSKACESCIILCTRPKMRRLMAASRLWHRRDVGPRHHLIMGQLWSKFPRHHFWQKRSLISKSSLIVVLVLFCQLSYVFLYLKTYKVGQFLIRKHQFIY